MRPTALLSLRKSLRAPPIRIPYRQIPPVFRRNITITPSGQLDNSTSDASGETNFELVSGSSQHPFASAYSDSSSSASSPSPSSSSTTSEADPSDEAESSTSSTPAVVNHLPQPPPPNPPVPLPHLQHPFDTHAFVTYLQRSEVNRGSAVVLMEAVKDLIVKRKWRALQRMLTKEENENVGHRSDCFPLPTLLSLHLCTSR